MNSQIYDYSLKVNTSLFYWNLKEKTCKFAIDCKGFARDVHLFVTSANEIHTTAEQNKWINADVETIEPVNQEFRDNNPLIKSLCLYTIKFKDTPKT